MGKNPITVICVLKCENISGVVVIRVWGLPKRYNVAVLLPVRGNERTRPKVAGEHVKAVCFRNITRLFFPVRVHLLYGDPGILRQDLINISPG